MNRYFKRFLHRGLIFGGLGPIVTAVVLLCISGFAEVALDARSFAVAVVSTYLLAFVQAGASVFNQIEEWGIAKSLAAHFSCLYAAYVFCYLVNDWIPFDIVFIGIFSAVFVAVYAFIWLTVYLIVTATARKLNIKLKKGRPA